MLSFGEAGGGNHESVGYDGLIAAVQQATAQALSRAALAVPDIAGAGFGVSGYDWPSERAATLRAIGTLGLSAPVECVNDTLIGLIAGAAAGWGVAVVSGTGCNCWGRDRQHRIAHLTGHGWFAGEGTGATELIEEAVRRVARHWSRRGPATQLTQAFINLTGAANIDDLMEGLLQATYWRGASAAPVVFKVAAQGDAVARDLIDWAGRELGNLAIGVIRQLRLESAAFDVVTVGSMFDIGSPLIDPMRDTLAGFPPVARVVRLTAPPVVGAVRLSLEQARYIPTPAIRATLARTVAEIRAAQTAPTGDEERQAIDPQ